MSNDQNRDRLPIRLRRWLVHGEAEARDLPLLLGAALLAVPAALVFALLVLAPLWHLLTGLVSGDADDGTALRNYALVLAAMLGAPFFVWRTIIANRQASTAEQGHDLQERRNLTDRFIKAVEMLGASDGDKPVLEQRLGGIYALEKLAAESTEDHVQIMEVLCAYIRTNAPAREAVEWPGTVVDRLRKTDPGRATILSIFRCICLPIDGWRGRTQSGLPSLN